MPAQSEVDAWVQGGPAVQQPIVVPDRKMSRKARREAERDLFVMGSYPTGTIPVWSVDRNGRVDFSRPIRRLSETEALALLRPLLNPPSTPMSPAPSTAATSTAPVQAAPSLTTRIFTFLKTLIGAQP